MRSQTGKHEWKRFFVTLKYFLVKKETHPSTVSCPIHDHSRLKPIFVVLLILKISLYQIMKTTLV